MNEIEQKYKLTAINREKAGEVKLPTVAEVRKSRERGTPITRVEIQQALEAVAPTAKTLEQLQVALRQVGIELVITPDRISSPKKRKKQSLPNEAEQSAPSDEAPSDSTSTATEDRTDEDSSFPPSPLPSPSVIPLLFSKDGLTFSASQLGKRYTWKGLQANFGLTSSAALEAAQSLELPSTSEKLQKSVKAEADIKGLKDVPSGLERVTSSHEQAYYKRWLNQIQQEISQKESLRSSYQGDLQIAVYALNRYPTQTVLKLLSQTKTAQAIGKADTARAAHHKGMGEVKLYIQQLLKAAQEQSKQREQTRDQER